MGKKCIICGVEAKFAILVASIFAGVSGYFFLSSIGKKESQKKEKLAKAA